MKTDQATNATPEAVCSTAMLGPLPEREAFARWMADTHAPALRRMDADGAHAAGYAVGVAAERERLAAACWERRGHFASDAAARAFAELVRDGRA